MLLLQETQRMKILGALALIVSLLLVGFGLFVLLHNANQKAIAQRNLARIKSETEALKSIPRGPQQDAQLQVLYDQFLDFGGMNAQANTNLTIGLVTLLGGVAVGFAGAVLLAVGIFRLAPGK
jgi:hypothetical protein